MRVPYSWLREVVSAGAPGWDVGPDELEQALVRIGHEVEEVARLGPVEGPLAVGRVAQIEELSGFKKPIRACLVDVGAGEPQEIVCGATNFVVGDLVVVALPGATLPGNFTIAARKTYGRNSNGMICSAAELGLGADHSGILVLPPGTAEPGTDGAAVLGLDDVVFHLAITPDRGYGLSVRGLAREIACAYDLDFVDPAEVEPLPAVGEAWPLTVDPDTGVRRFALRPVTGIDPAAVSPWWLQRRLLLCGIRATSPAVDVTNYVMLELGHPMHAHDRTRITGGFQVRFARPGETVVTLDDIERKLEPVDVLIVDDVATAAIGGVMGADSTEVRADSTDVLLEAAVWDPAAISRTQRRLHLPSEAARRYERAVDPAISVAVLDRCARLLVDIAGGVVEPTLTDWRGDPPRNDWSPPPIEIPADLPDRIAGVAYAPGTTARRLTQVGARVRQDAGTLTVTPPSWRPDLQQPADLVEEVLRLEGLEAIPSVLPSAPAGRGLTATQRRRRAIGQVAGVVRLRRDPADTVPAGRCVRPVGTAGRRPSAQHHQRGQSAGSRPPAAGHHIVAGPAGSAAPQRFPRTGRCRAVCDRAGGATDRADPRRRPHPGTPAAHRCRDRQRWTLRYPANPSTSPRCWQGCASRAGPGVRAGPPKPPTRSRRYGSSRAPAGWT